MTTFKTYLPDITSVTDAIKRLKELQPIYKAANESLGRGIPSVFPFGIWFRGHGNAEFDLKPKVFRKFIGAMTRDNESQRHDETNLFLLSGVRLGAHRHRYADDFDWLCLMQHYGLPTRLLDWTESILVALYFAVKEVLPDSPDAELVVLNARGLARVHKRSGSLKEPRSHEVILRSMMAHHRSRTEFSRAVAELGLKIHPEKLDPERLRLPVAAFPSRFNDRMVFQSSVFTLHGGKFYHDGEYIRNDDKLGDPLSLEDIDKSERQNQNPILYYCRIPGRFVECIRTELFTLGLHEGSLFPEMDRQAEYLRGIW